MQINQKTQKDGSKPKRVYTTSRRRRQRRREGAQNDGHERWLITYSDLITLLLIFFVIMFGISKTNEIKFQQLELTMAKAFHQGGTLMNNNNIGPVVSVSPAQPAKTPDSSQDQKNLNDLYLKVKAYIQSHNLQSNVSITNEPQGVRITLRDVVLFDTGKSDLKPDAKQLLNGLIPFFQQLNNAIIIEGFTDDQPINTPEFKSNWELSSARAVNVVEYLGGKGINSTRLSGEAFGQYHPVVPNTTPANRQTNRRINIVIVREGQLTQ